MLLVSEEWKNGHPGAVVGMLVMRGVANCGRHDGLQAAKARIQSELRLRYPAVEALQADPTLRAYKSYYKSFGRTYHLFGQLESVALKGRELPAVNGLVDAMFMTELKNRLLTAGHDLDACSPPFTVASASGTERFTTMRGEDKELKRGDMMIRDSTGILSCILHGPDRRSRIEAETRNTVFFVYAPAGIPEVQVRSHLEDLRGFVFLISPAAVVDAPEVVTA